MNMFPLLWLLFCCVIVSGPHCQRHRGGEPGPQPGQMGSFWQRDRCGRLWWESACIWCWRGEWAWLSFFNHSISDYSALSPRRVVADGILPLGALICTFSNEWLITQTMGRFILRASWGFCSKRDFTCDPVPPGAVFEVVIMPLHSKLRCHETTSGPALSARWQRSTRTETMLKSWRPSAWLPDLIAVDTTLKGPVVHLLISTPPGKMEVMIRKKYGHVLIHCTLIGQLYLVCLAGPSPVFLGITWPQTWAGSHDRKRRTVVLFLTRCLKFSFQGFI